MRTLTEFRAAMRRRAEDRQLRSTPSKFGVALFDSIHHVAAEAWDAVAATANVFLSRHYLAALEASESRDINFRYAMLFDGKRPVAVVSAQLIGMTGASVGSRVQDEEADDKASLVDKVKGVARKAKDKLEARVLVCGNAFQGGETGFAHVPDMDPEEAFQGLAEALYRIRRADKLHGQVSALLVKDFPVAADESHAADELQRFGYRQFEVDPSMSVPLRDWQTFDDYLAAMTGKYRRRVKSARKKGKALQRQQLDAAGLEQHGERIDELLEAVAEKASLRLVEHPRRYFIALKHALGDDLRVTTYSLGDRIVGFRSTVLCGDVVEAHRLGVDQEHNTPHAVYQNMLYDYVAEGIEARARVVSLGRTALEIKSAIGAEPVPMRCFIRHRSGVANRAIKPLFRFVKPTNWTPRNPFGDEA